MRVSSWPHHQGQVDLKLRRAAELTQLLLVLPHPAGSVPAPLSRVAQGWPWPCSHRSPQAWVSRGSPLSCQRGHQLLLLPCPRPWAGGGWSEGWGGPKGSAGGEKGADRPEQRSGSWSP